MLQSAARGSTRCRFDEGSTPTCGTHRRGVLVVPLLGGHLEDDFPIGSVGFHVHMRLMCARQTFEHLPWNAVA